MYLGILCLLVVSPAADRPAELVANARKQLPFDPVYSPEYVKLDYPGGDVSWKKGVCTDVVIRAYRGINLDLQQLVHEDILKAKSAYGIQRPDTNIDHRRVPNLQVFFKRKGVSYVLGKKNWRPGDVVTWKLNDGKNHIGLCSDKLNRDGEPYVIHNAGKLVEEDCLHTWKVTGHFRYKIGQ